MTNKVQLVWEGKQEAIDLYNSYDSSNYELKENKDRSINPDTTENIIIEGDNLPTLFLLKEKYAEKVKMIYIDPPYNTGKKGMYNDKFLARRECKHSKWLSMMYPRLKLARELLRDDGVIFVSIDDHEQANLKLLMDEVFGGGSFVSELVWRKTDNQANIGNIARVKEYILIYCKNSDSLVLQKMNLTERAKKEYRYNDEKGCFRRSILLHKTRGRFLWEINTPTGNKLNGPWMVKKNIFDIMNKNNEIYWAKGGSEQPYGKIYLHSTHGQIANDFLDTEYGTNQEGSLEVEKLFGNRIFDFPKPISLLKHFLAISIDSEYIKIGFPENNIILDFFAGSGTTGHAVMQLNMEDKKKAIEKGEDPELVGNRKYIMVQLPEPIKEETDAYKAGYKNISDITIDRIKRAREKIAEANPDIELDTGFKVFKLTESNFKDEDSVHTKQLELWSETKV